MGRRSRVWQLLQAGEADWLVRLGAAMAALSDQATVRGSVRFERRQELTLRWLRPDADGVWLDEGCRWCGRDFRHGRVILGVYCSNVCCDAEQRAEWEWARVAQEWLGQRGWRETYWTVMVELVGDDVCPG